MVEFVMPTCEELVAQLHAQRREMVSYFDRDGWTPGARQLLDRLDRLIARYEG
ncbi:hypothetical protein HRJ34_18020 [Rhizorhabdus wittichii]|uniref:Uncharacterized protein n=1 Tax=Rhizorhabdus wittichii TaxID=160791 RepID=A0A975D0Y1_9SPHN|nr:MULTISPECIES: hypothetical protein [Sphingomonadaceae]QTH20231.1 hypothetical protein HRJ34_18020 [Rhizorhabdus wittichii]